MDGAAYSEFPHSDVGFPKGDSPEEFLANILAFLEESAAKLENPAAPPVFSPTVMRDLAAIQEALVVEQEVRKGDAGHPTVTSRADLLRKDIWDRWRAGQGLAPLREPLTDAIGKLAEVADRQLILLQQVGSAASIRQPASGLVDRSVLQGRRDPAVPLPEQRWRASVFKTLAGDSLASLHEQPKPQRINQSFTRVRVGRYTLTNRLVMAPMTRNCAKLGGTPGELAAEYYAQRASVGLIVTEGTQPSPIAWNASSQRLGIIGIVGEHSWSSSRAVDGGLVPLTPQRIVHDVHRVIPPDEIVALDNGIYKIWFARIYRTRAANTAMYDKKRAQ